jgi:hypothetical protein
MGRLANTYAEMADFAEQNIPFEASERDLTQLTKLLINFRGYRVLGFEKTEEGWLANLQEMRGD